MKKLNWLIIALLCLCILGSTMLLRQPLPPFARAGNFYQIDVPFSVSSGETNVQVVDLEPLRDIDGYFALQIVELDSTTIADSGVTTLLSYATSNKNSVSIQQLANYTTPSMYNGLDLTTGTTPYVVTISPEPAKYLFLKTQAGVTGYTLMLRLSIW